MKDSKHAMVMLEMAKKDFKALRGMTSRKFFAEEIFGFHAQQAVETLLKAWSSAIGVAYPKTHDIRVLLSLLEEEGCKVGKFWDLVEFNAFAVQFRYEAFNSSKETLDREGTCRRIRNLLTQITRKIKK
jgi:HEPN domain-containing protein